MMRMNWTMLHSAKNVGNNSTSNKNNPYIVYFDTIHHKSIINMENIKNQFLTPFPHNYIPTIKNSKTNEELEYDEICTGCGQHQMVKISEYKFEKDPTISYDVMTKKYTNSTPPRWMCDKCNSMCDTCYGDVKRICIIGGYINMEKIHNPYGSCVMM